MSDFFFSMPMATVCVMCVSLCLGLSQDTADRQRVSSGDGWGRAGAADTAGHLGGGAGRRCLLPLDEMGRSGRHGAQDDVHLDATLRTTGAGGVTQRAARRLLRRWEAEPREASHADWS